MMVGPQETRSLLRGALGAVICAGTLATTMGTAGAQEPAGLDLSAVVGPPGTQVAVSMDGLPPSAGIVIAFGSLRGGYQWVEETETAEDGTLEQTVRVPAWAETGVVHYFFLKFPGQAPLAVSDAFYVTDAENRIRARGEITAQEEEWFLLRGLEGELYCLIGNVSGLEPGDEVRVVGTVADPTPCEQGIPVDVHELEIEGAVDSRWRSRR